MMMYVRWYSALLIAAAAVIGSYVSIFTAVGNVLVCFSPLFPSLPPTRDARWLTQLCPFVCPTVETS
jgi:hypothetical protein